MKQAGFTLVEILAAVTITAIIFLSLFALVQQSFQLWEALGVYNYWEQNFRMLEAELTRDLQNIYCTSLTTKNLLQASEQQMKFYQLSNTGRLQEITYSFAKYDRKLIKEVVSVDNKKVEERLEFFANHKIRRVRWQFYDAQTEYFSSKWSYQKRLQEVETKPSRQQLTQLLPQTIKIEIELAAVKLPPLLIENFSGRVYGR